MVDSIFSILLAIVGLGFLIFIHELGHYIVARLVGMQVEVFSIGFGRSLYQFHSGTTVIKLGWIPFGGYVKIAGMESSEKEGSDEERPDTIAAKCPWKRIQVYLAGPFANILFAFLLFTVIWYVGGRQRSYSEINSRIGWVDSSSELYKKGVRSGDKILRYNGKKVTSSRDHIYAAMTQGPSILVEVEKLIPNKDNNSNFLQFDARSYQHPLVMEKGIMTTGVLAPATFLIWKPMNSYLTSSHEKSGIQPNDRIMWADGHSVFSNVQLGSLVNRASQFITVTRNGSYIHLSIPRVRVEDIKSSAELRGELSDWQYESGLDSVKFGRLWFLPYSITVDGVVEDALDLLDSENHLLPALDVLLPGDKIVSIAGRHVTSGAEILKSFQHKKVLLVAQRSGKTRENLSESEADDFFVSPYRSVAFKQLVESIGTNKQIEEKGDFVLFNPIEPKTEREFFPDNEEGQVSMKPQQLYLGLFGIYDMSVVYNPNPVQMCYSIVGEIYQTLQALITGSMSPKWMGGPVGIVHIMQKQLVLGYEEIFFWLGMISMNLAIINLLPLPILDGGGVFFALIELTVGVRFKPETVEKIIFPFAVLLISFLIYLTYNDIVRIVSTFF